MNAELFHEAKETFISKVKANKKAAISIGAAVVGAFALLFFITSNKEERIIPQQPEMTSFRDQLRQQNLIELLAVCNSKLAEAYEVPQSFLLECDDYYREASNMSHTWKVKPRLIEETKAVEKNLRRFISKN
jgi:hypothetical protein|nr:MAG TPA: hypothetical protein [Caudoviricetes sp.]